MINETNKSAKKILFISLKEFWSAARPTKLLRTLKKLYDHYRKSEKRKENLGDHTEWNPGQIFCIDHLLISQHSELLQVSSKHLTHQQFPNFVLQQHVVTIYNFIILIHKILNNSAAHEHNSHTSTFLHKRKYTIYILT